MAAPVAIVAAMQEELGALLAAMPAFQEAIAKHDPLRATIEPVEAKATPENSASYQRSPD